MGINDFFLSIRLDWKRRLAVPCNCSTQHDHNMWLELKDDDNILCLTLQKLVCQSVYACKNIVRCTCLVV